jgi:ABC-type multidrug transport system ATPase subunit
MAKVGYQRRGIFWAVMRGVEIRFEDVGKRFDERVVFRGVSGEAVPGEVLAITGPNGSGKSTLVAILCGLVRPTRGVVRHLVAGSPVERSEWRRHLGIVAPAIAVYEELDAMENLRFLARVRGMTDCEDRCRDCLDQVGLDPDRHTLVRGFSTGMLQRLKIAQAMLHRPDVLFLDEPGSNLDPAGQDWLEGWVQSVVADGRTVVLATNDRHEMSWGTCRVALAG